MLLRSILRPLLVNEGTIRPADYWDEARLPLVSFCFLLPFLIGHELALYFLSGSASGLSSGGADLWIRGWLLKLGGQLSWSLPGLLGLVLLASHYVRKDEVRIRISTLSGMLGESLLFALLLIVAGQSLHSLMERPLTASVMPALVMTDWASSSLQSRLISSVGAGLYEEFLFRLLLIPVLCGGLMLLRVPRTCAIVVTVLISAVIFSTAHYLSPDEHAFSPLAYVDTLERIIYQPAYWYSALFRCLAGLVFGLLFVYRGFGVTAGAHVCYDVLVGIMLTLAPETAC